MRGLFLFLPALATIYVLWVILRWLDNILPTDLPGLGILLLITALTVLGYIGTHWLGPTLIASVEERIKKIPVVGFIYSSVRELVEGSKRANKFDRPVLVRLEPEGVYQIGFITHENPPVPHDLIAVYTPYAFSFMGNVVFVPKNRVEPLSMKAAEALRFVLSGAIISAESSDDKHDT
ncbi:MAG: DUF502 domain-containing protein [Bacteroidia bacterium]|nr:DUF502 domain-containing protein [Bacteroidia bacterium]MDW8236289.1 DUF502 domain-containing protein [Bacteroidia bacterium]